ATGAVAGEIAPAHRCRRVVEQSAAVRGGIAGEGAVVEEQRPSVVNRPAPVRAIAGELAEADGQLAAVRDAAAVRGGVTHKGIIVESQSSLVEDGAAKRG